MDNNQLRRDLAMLALKINPDQDDQKILEAFEEKDVPKATFWLYRKVLRQKAALRHLQAKRLKVYTQDTETVGA